MAEQNRFDIIIAGAGAAGLSLLWRILESHSLQNPSILLIDQSFEPADDKTWCFWEDLELPDAKLVHHTWNNLLVRFGENIYSEKLKQYEYKCIRSKVFSEYIIQKARSSTQVTFLQADIKNFTCSDKFGFAHTSEGHFESKKIFQSVLKPPGFNKLEVDISLLQHFLGWEIECGQNLFAPNIGTFMDFDVPQKNGISFIYLLPFSKNKALVEYTVFSKSRINKDQYRRQIRNYMKTRYNLKKGDYTVKREELGAIPMEDRKHPAQFCNFVWNIGTVSGIVKPSTGYTFSRVQKHCLQIITALESGKEIQETHGSSYRFRVYDLMMLYLLQHEKDDALNAFNYLFRKNNFDRVLQFLAEETTPTHELAIFLKMPYKPFLKSIYNMKCRIFYGA